MNPHERSLRTLFAEALEITDPHDRETYLDRVAAGDAELRRRLVILLDSDAAAGGFLRLPEGGAEAPSENKFGAARIGPYRLGESLGEGGCGTVYLADQEQPIRRQVALKVIKLGMDTEAVVARFQLERQALALMDHPGIAKVLDAGTTGAPGSEIMDASGRLAAGRPYFVMELVRGPRLTDYCDEHRLCPSARLELFIQVCRAVQHAHQKGVIHRDLKPSNILVGSIDGTPRPKVIDFGIAKATADQRLADHTLFTSVDQFLGTPAYMSPEQAGMSGDDIDTRSDIYSLGVLLYELLVGRTPFEARELWKAGFDEMRRIIREREPIRPSTRLSTLTATELADTATRRGCEPPRLPHLLRGDLDWIVMKCLEKDRSRRYETANGLAADLQRYLEHEPVLARPPSNAYRFRKLVRRNKLAFAGAVAVGTAMLFGMTVSLWQARKARQAAEERRLHLYAADMESAFAALESGNVIRTRQLLDEHRSGERGREDLRGFDWRWLYGRSRPREIQTLEAPERIGFNSVSADGTWLATGGSEGVVRLWSLQPSREVACFRTVIGIVYSLDFSKDGRQLAAALHEGSKRWVYLFNTENLQAVGVLEGHSQAPFSVRFSPLSDEIVTSGGHPYAAKRRGELFLWEASSRRKLRQLDGFGETSIGWIDISSDGSWLATPHGDGRIHLWNTSTWQIDRTLLGHHGLVIAARFSPDGNRLASTGEDGTVRLWHLPTGRGEVVSRSAGGKYYALRFSPDGRWIVIGGDGNLVRLFDVESSRELTRLSGHSDRVFCLNFVGPKGGLVTTSYDGTAKLWPLPEGHSETFLSSQDVGNALVSFGPDSRWLVRTELAEPGQTTIWDSQTRKPIARLNGIHPSFSSDGRFLAVVAGTNRVAIRDASDLELRMVRELTLDGRIDRAPVFSRDNRWVAVGCQGQTSTLAVWSLASADGPIHLRDPQSVGQVTYCHFSPDSRLVAVSHDDCTTRFWRIDGWRPLHRIEHPGAQWPIVFSPDWRWMAVGVWDVIRVFDVGTGKPRDLRGHAGMVRALAFTPDGRTLGVGTHQGQVQLWNVSTWREVAKLAIHNTVVHSLAFAPDGRAMATTCFNGETKLMFAPGFEETDALSAPPPVIRASLEPR